MLSTAMAGTRIQNNAAPPDSALSTATNRSAAAYYNTSAQSLYSDLWQDMRNYLDNYCAITGGSQNSAGRAASSSLTDFSSPPSNQGSLSYQQPYSFANNINGTVNFANLSAGSDATPISLQTDSTTVAPTIQFDLGSNLLNCPPEQPNMTNFSAPYDYSSNAGSGTQMDASQSCFPNDSPLASQLWNMGNNNQSFGCPSSSQGSLSTTNLGNVSTVDYTARWDVSNNNQSSSPVNQGNQSSLNNNLRKLPEPFEGRLRPYVRYPSPGVEHRIERALEHRLYVIDQKLLGDQQAPTGCDYQVLGASGNVYTVRLATIPSCTCPDKSRPCKHILFIMLRVLKLSSDDYRIWQTALQTSEFIPDLRKTRLDSDVLASQQVRQRFQEISNQVAEGHGDADVKMQNLQREVTGDCPVCFELMGNEDGSAKEELSFCKVCGNNVHKDCFKRWCVSRQESGERVTCIFCRSLWFDDSQQLKKRKATSDVGPDGYVNLADYSTDHRPEDITLERLYPQVRPKYLREWRGY